MEQGYLIDTNVIIDNFGGKLPERSRVFLNEIDIIISSITKVEVLGWPGATKKNLRPLYDFMDVIKILPIDDAVIEKTIVLRQSQKIALGDALIAATALNYKISLITRNTKDFKNIKNLEVVNPFEV